MTDGCPPDTGDLKERKDYLRRVQAGLYARLAAYGVGLLVLSEFGLIETYWGNAAVLVLAVFTGMSGVSLISAHWAYFVVIAPQIKK